MDDNTLKAIERLCDLAESQANDSNYAGESLTLDIIGSIIAKVDPNKPEQRTGEAVV